MKLTTTALYPLTICLAFLATLVPSAHSTPITVPNYSFETPGGNAGVSGANNNNGFIPNWTANSPTYYGDQVIVGQFANAGNSQGSAYLFMNLDRPGSATLTSGSLATIADNSTYELTVALGNHNQTGAYGDPGDMTISLLANGSIIPAATLTLLNGTVPNGFFQDYSVSFSTGSGLANPLFGENLSVQLGTASGGQTQASFDNVRLIDVSNAPEPSTYTMMLAGLAILGLCVRHKASQLK